MQRHRHPGKEAWSTRIAPSANAGTPWTTHHPFLPPCSIPGSACAAKPVLRRRGSLAPNLLQGFGVQELSLAPLASLSPVACQLSTILASSPQTPVPSKSLGQGNPNPGSPEPKLLQNNQLSPHPFFKTERQRLGEDEAPITVFEMKFGAQRDTCTACNVQPWTSKDHQLLKKPHPSKRKAFLKATVAAEPPGDWLIIWFKSQY